MNIKAFTKATIYGTFLLLLLTLGACKKKVEDGEKKFIANAKPFEGVYKITSRTENKASCKVEGKSMLDKDSERFIAMSLARGLMGKVIALTSCKDVANCRARAKKPDAADFIYTLSGNEGKTLTGMVAFTGFSRGGKTCKKGRLSKLTAVKKGKDVTVELKGATVDYPVDDEGMCNTKLVKKHAEGKPCNYYMVLRANRVDSL